MSEKIVVVDKQDNIIAYKNRNKLVQQDIYRVSALWITNSQGEHLLAQRAFTKEHNPGKWGPAVAGTVEKGESYKDNIIKETKEELGLENIDIIEGPKNFIAGEYNYFTQWFTAVVDKPIGDFKIQKDEVNCIKWFSEEELQRNIKNNPDMFSIGLSEYIKICSNKK